MSQVQAAPENKGNGQGDASELDRLLASARDSLTDDIVTRVSAALGGGLDLLDRVNRSGLEQALPAIKQLVDNGDLQRVVDMARLLASAQDSLSDDIVCRLSATIGDGMDLLDRVNRSGVSKALPAIAKLVENGDLERMVNVARVLASAADSLSEDIISRLAIVVTEGLSLLDRLARNEGLSRMLGMLEHKETQDLLIGLGDALVATSQDLAQAPPAKGGVSALWHVAKQPGTQDGMQILSLVGRHLGEQWRKNR